MTILNIKEVGRIANMEAMPRGLNARYLECIVAHNGDLVASCWRRKLPAKYSVIVDFKQSKQEAV